MTEHLGIGSYGKVKLAINTDTNEKFAIKIIKRDKFRSRAPTDGKPNGINEETKDKDSTSM